MLARLDDAAVRQRRFVADASHELKSPVAAMRTILDVSGDSLDAQVRKPVSADLSSEVMRLETLIANLLALARADEGDPQSRWTDIDLDQIVGLEATALARRTELQVGTSQIAAARVRGNATSLQTAVRNLLDNASAHAKTEITVAVDVEEDDAIVVIADDGAGIPQQDWERVFDRFYTTDPARSRSGGSGLGLAVVRTVARAHGGDAAVVVSPLGGAAIEMRVPAVGT